ncbi:hypothetical protein BA724_01460 [Domibacillus iocasae]|uniref:Uncharacterized protein n=1 Tax=Domibacillus iocasae TaxID=1714016 RepID=A0A1E7DR27_9BACI|nr:hypothetical protein BA724_01460 [Domibacillus iocasae]
MQFLDLQKILALFMYAQQVIHCNIIGIDGVETKISSAMTNINKFDMGAHSLEGVLIYVLASQKKSLN